jgi:hypothetical protein
MRPRTAIAALTIALAGCTATQTPALGPGRAWHIAYNGYGHISARAHGDAVRLTLEPARPKSPASTHAALVISARTWRNFAAEIRLRTNRQLRRRRPNPWEVGWVLWHYVNDQRFYYVILKPNGWELGKEDPSYRGGQRFLVTDTSPVFPPGRWYTVRVKQHGNVIQVNVDGRRLVRFTDTRHPYLAGRIGLYVEDASATFLPGTITAEP